MRFNTTIFDNRDGSGRLSFSVIAVAVAAAAVLLLAACDPGPAEGSGAAVVEEAPDEDAADDNGDADDEGDDGDAADAEGEGDDTDAEGDDAADAGDEGDGDAQLGTRDDPLAVGTRIEMGDWTLAVTEVMPDATDVVMAENEFNDPPADGRQFVMFTVDATYEGEDSGTAWLDFSWAIVGSEGNTFATGADDYCGVIPDPLDDTGETFPDGSVSGNVCISAESAQVDGATIRIEDTFSFEDTRAFYALD